MARSKISTRREVKYGGMTYTSRIEEVVNVCIPDLGLRPEFSVDGDDILLSCGNQAAANEVERVFPSEEWVYSFRTSKRTVGYDSKWKNRKQNPYLFIRVENREDGDVCFVEFFDMTEEDYTCLRDFYLRLFPSANIRTLEEYHRSLVDEILMMSEYMGGEIGERISKKLFGLPDEEYRLILDMIRARENEYIEGKVMEPSNDDMSDVIADEVVKALVMKAKAGNGKTEDNG